MQCKHCGQEISYPTDLQCRNDVIAELQKEGWDLVALDTEDHWYCKTCREAGFMPGFEFAVPGTVEYRGFTITFVNVHGEGDTKLRCQIREDDDFIQESTYSRMKKDGTPVEQEFERMVSVAKNKIDVLYDILESTLEKFHKMTTKQRRRQMIDPRVDDKVSSFRTQMAILDAYFMEK